HFPVNRELLPFIQRYNLPFELFDELVKGCEMDLTILRYENYEALEQYCYRVASVVGLLSIEIFGHESPACREYAIALGKALQLTKLLGYFSKDGDRGRIYLPVEELRRFNVTEQEILDHQYSERYAKLAASVAERAKNYYRIACKTLPAEDR